MQIIHVTAESLLARLRKGKRMAPVFWTTEAGQAMYGGGYCWVKQAHTFIQHTPKTVGIEVSPAIVGAQEAIRDFGGAWVEVD